MRKQKQVKQKQVKPMKDDGKKKQSGELTEKDLEKVTGGVQWRPDGSGGGNITAKYDLVKAKGA